MPQICETTRFGKLEVQDEDIIVFPKGIPGFELHDRWILAGEEDNPVKWLQSLVDGGIALPVVIPQTIADNYNARIPEEDLVQLKTEDVGDLAILIVVAIPPAAPWDMTANLRAPIVINHKKRLACQIIVQNEEYDVRTPFLSDDVKAFLRKKATEPAGPDSPGE